MRYEITAASMEANDVTISTTIREQSAGKVEIGLDIPLDPFCRIEVKFPQDMPLTADLTHVSSVGVLTTTGKVVPNKIELAKRSFYLDGCSQYEKKISNVLSMFNMRNKDNVRITESFAVYLWAID
jgi:hypothetical protein